ncbi:PAP2 superfamily-domain-containing protein [Irpex rosettiformis]|uniref:PAP2 superfamily-domain-containing protein n=1 Tax=Irpex rosettiformis TaxID=378272 RepID=A0ACB8U459_9APHY|nr:PAP2 superfamily-domain-containing protein [Irpex rosettiformis]
MSPLDSKSDSPADKAARTSSEKSESDDGLEDVPVTAIGILPDEVYDRTMNWWRAGIRRSLGRTLAWEAKMIARMQERVRTPFLDTYFVNTSSLGTHTFFMTMLPAFCFFGYQDVTQGLLFSLSLGVYITSFIKDSVCSPRPFSPPVTRLTIGTHHLEYGFPSTHSTNSVSIALYFFTILHRLYTTPATVYSPPIAPSAPHLQNAAHIIEDILPEMRVTQTTYIVFSGILLFYVFSIVYGRLYTGMHSFTDCTVGVLIGASIWGLHVLVGDIVDSWLKTAGWIVPATVIPSVLLMVHRHPEPVDDCPCFEDAIAFMSVVMGEFLTRWYMARYGFDDTFFVRSMPGNPFGSLSEMWTWWTIATAKMTIGILVIFAWRIVAKFMCHHILPPTFRLLAQLFTLPHRRYYTPATDYTNVPADKGLRAFPSVLDLPGMIQVEADGMSTARNNDAPHRHGVVKQRGTRYGRGHEKLEEETEVDEQVDSELGGKKGESVLHYDADVLTKVFVYCGIAILATGVMPVVFEVIGWGLPP